MLHIATFKGRHNSVKSKVLIVLYHRRFKLGNRTGVGVAELAGLTGCNYNYLKSRLGKWAGWRYINRSLSIGERGHPAFLYSIDDRGKRFVEERLPRVRLEQYVSEIKLGRAKNES